MCQRGTGENSWPELLVYSSVHTNTHSNTQTHRHPTCEGREAGRCLFEGAWPPPTVPCILEWCQHACGKIPFLSYTHTHICAHTLLLYHTQSLFRETHSGLPCHFYNFLRPIHTLAPALAHITRTDSDFLPLLFFLTRTDRHLAGCVGRKRGRKTTPRLGVFCHGSVADFKRLGSLPICQISFFSHPVCPHPSLFTGGEVNIWYRETEKGSVREGWAEEGWKPPVAPF